MKRVTFFSDTVYIDGSCKVILHNCTTTVTSTFNFKLAVFSPSFSKSFGLYHCHGRYIHYTLTNMVQFGKNASNLLHVGALPQTSLELTMLPLTRYLYLKGLLLRGGTRRGEWNEKEMAKGREGEKRWREGFWPSQKFWPGAPYGLGYRSNAVIKVWCRYLKNLWQKESVGYFLTTLWVVPFQSRCSAHRVLQNDICLSVTVTRALCMPTAAEQSLL